MVGVHAEAEGIHFADWLRSWLDALRARAVAFVSLAEVAERERERAATRRVVARELPGRVGASRVPGARSVMRAVVCAYGEIGAASLETLLELGVDVALVVTHEDAPGERVWFRSVARSRAQRGRARDRTRERERTRAARERSRTRRRTSCSRSTSATC